MIYLDFEARSAAKIAPRRVSVGVINYARHESTQPLSLCYAFDDEPVQEWTPWRGREDLARRTYYRRDLAGKIDMSCPADLRDRVLAGETICAHNAMFDRTFWLAVMTKWYGWPRTPLGQWVCSSATARYNGLPGGLADANEFLRLSPKGDNSALEKLRSPRKQWVDKRKGAAWVFDDATYEEMLKYNRGDVIAMRDLYKTIRPLTPSERDLWLVDQEINLTGVPIDRELADAASVKSDEVFRDLCMEIHGLTGGAIASPNQRDKLLAWLQRRVVIKNMQAGELAFVLKHGQMDAKTRRVIEIRQLGGGNAQAKYKAIPRLATGNRAYDGFQYYGGHTGRASAQGIQYQNAVRPPLQHTAVGPLIEPFKRGEDLSDRHPIKDILDSMVRCTVAALPGYTLVANDLSQVEARGVLWLAGETFGLERFRSGVDQYILMAARIFHREVTKEESYERGIGKSAVLGCGFGMGSNRFAENCAERGIDITDAVAAAAVKAYRDMFPGVVKLWYEVEKCATAAVRTGKVQTLSNKLIFSCEKTGPYNTLVITLPSGRDLFYPDVQLEKGNLTYMGKNNGVWGLVRTWGGSLVENIVQAFCRDILMGAKKRVHAWLKGTGYGEIVMHVHDEIVVHALLEYATVILERLRSEMEHVPIWARGIPLATEGWINTFYTK